MSLFSKSRCKCSKLATRITGWRTDPYFQSMNQVGSRNDGWRKFLECSCCGQCWLVDEWDKLPNLYAIKIDNPEKFSDQKFLEIHKVFLLKAHSGNSEIFCKMSNCNNKAVNDFVFCAECLISKQGIFE